MSHREKLEQVLELLINEETDAASELLHNVIVEKARTMYEDLVDEDFGGDEKEDFAGDIEADKDEIESDEIFDGEEGEEGEEDFGEEPAEEEEVEDRLEDVESQLAELTMQFDALANGEEGIEGEEGFDVDGGEEFGGEEGFGDVDAELGGEEDYAEESMYEEVIDELEEATKLQDTVADTGQGQEGKYSGTGKNSKIGATGKESMFTKAPSKADHGGKPVVKKGSDEATKKVGEGEDNTPTSNIDVKTGEKKSADVSAKDDKGAKSPLGSSGSPKGN
jgi:hypothetical protein